MVFPHSWSFLYHLKFTIFFLKENKIMKKYLNQAFQIVDYIDLRVETAVQGPPLGLFKSGLTDRF